MMLPKVKTTKTELNLERLVEFLNTEHFQENYRYSGRFKIDYRQLSNSRFNPEEFI